MNRRPYGIAFAFLLVLSLLVFMPLRAIIGGDGISARRVDGIIWDGSVRDLRVGRLPVGDVNARLRFWPLVLGRAQFEISRGAAPLAPGVSGSVTRRIGGFQVEKLNATLPVQNFFAPLPADNLELQDFSVRFIAGRCAEASGNVRLTLGASLPGIDLANGLLAKPRCEGGKLLIPLVSQSAMERVNIRIAGDGSYELAVMLEGNRTEQAALLALAGFRSVTGGYRLAVKGKF